MYQYSIYSRKIKDANTGEIFNQDMQEPRFLEYLEWANLGNAIESVDYFPEEYNQFRKAEVDVQLNPILKTIVEKALIFAMNRKYMEDLNYYEVAYRTKYAMCKGTKDDPYNTIFQESLLEGYDTVDEFKADVISKFEAGEQFRDSIIQLTEVVRKAIYKDMDVNEDFDKPYLRMDIINQISGTPIQDIIPLFQSAIAL